jgi:hypothetical protein
LDAAVYYLSGAATRRIVTTRSTGGGQRADLNLVQKSSVWNLGNIPPILPTAIKIYLG